MKPHMAASNRNGAGCSAITEKGINQAAATAAVVDEGKYSMYILRRISSYTDPLFVSSVLLPLQKFLAALHQKDSGLLYVEHYCRQV